MIALMPSPTTRSASMSRPESVSSSTAKAGSSTPIWTISARFFSPPEKPTFTARLSMSMSILSSAAFSLASLRNSPPDSGSSPRAVRWALSASRRNWTLETPGISTGYWKPRNRPDRGAFVRFEFEQILAHEGHAAAGHLVARPAAEHVGKRRLARAVGAHDRVNLARADFEREAAEDFGAADFGVEVVDFQHHDSSLAGARTAQPWSPMPWKLSSSSPARNQKRCSVRWLQRSSRGLSGGPSF